MPCVEVDWLEFPVFEGIWPVYRACDFCHESFIDDAMENKPIRQFFELLDECGCIACEHCLPGVELVKGAESVS